MFICGFNNKPPLRYPGGKTRACKKLETIMKDHFNINDFDNLISPFFGSGPRSTRRKRKGTRT